MTSSLDQLLDNIPHEVAPRGRRIRLPDGIECRLLSNARDDQVMLASSPGELPAEEAQLVNQTLWHHTLTHPMNEEIRLSVVVPAGSSRVLLVDVWPRHAVEKQSFEQLLDEHARRHRSWREALEPQEEEDENIEGATPTAEIASTVPPEHLA